jgi:diaminohydroxyphosphoribosylaminopyrimidine deaminase/5-amino-6-(5-phosphoribosylamino)uracil reductase
MDEYYMKRCLELAGKGIGSSRPNPMVGCVIVCREQIIGEGYHRAYGEAHAEVNAIASVRNSGLLAESTLYVNLEPCSHFGKTPPCSELILENRIPRVVVGTADPNPVVGGKGLKHLEENGTEVQRGVLEAECLDLNKRVFTYHEKKRPWILLKWAQTEDGFIDIRRGDADTEGVNWITGKEARQWVHKWRSEEQAILVGTRTAMIDNPELTVRDWEGENPLRVVIDRKGILPGHLKIFNDEADTLVFTSVPRSDFERVKFFEVPMEQNYPEAILGQLYESEISSIMVEGGAQLLKSFIDSGIWDEARVFTGKKKFGTGLPAPSIPADPVRKLNAGNDLLEIFKQSHATNRAFNGSY